MKNLYFLAAVAAFALGSCTVEEALDPPADPEDEAKAIGFGTFLDRAPQNGIKPLATILDIGGLKTRKSGFKVEAYRHSTDWDDWDDGARTATPNFMSDQTVTWAAASTATLNPGTWTYNPIRYWPVNGTSWQRVSFFAYTPAQSTSTTITFVPAGAKNKNPKIHYVMPVALSSQADFIVDAKYNVTGYNNSEVKFNFDHVLSRIGFQAKLKEDYEDVIITITNLLFYYNGLCNSGAYTFSSSTVTGSNKDPINWDVTGANKIPDGILNILIGSPATLTTTPKNLTENSSPTRYLMLIPQENALEQAYVRVEYTIHYPPGTIPETHDNIAKVFLPPITWKPGIAYTYTLNIALKALEIAVEEAGWNVWDEVEVIPPINIPDIP